MSQDDPLKDYIPRRLDDPPKFLFWDWDVATMAGIGLYIGVDIVENLYVGIALAVLIGWQYGKLKAGKHPGFFNHILYWFFNLRKPKVIPPSYMREFVG